MRGGAHEVVAHAVHVGRGPSRAAPGCAGSTASARPRRAASCRRPAARRSPPTSAASSPCGRRAPSWIPIRACARAVHEIHDALPGRHVLGLVHAGAAGTDAGLAADVGHLGHHQAGAADARGCRGGPGASRPACRPPPSTGTSARPPRGWPARSSRRRNGVNIGGGGDVAGDADAALPRGVIGEPAVHRGHELRRRAP